MLAASGGAGHGAGGITPLAREDEAVRLERQAALDTLGASCGRPLDVAQALDAVSRVAVAHTTDSCTASWASAARIISSARARAPCARHSP